jgi:AhpD family alkylhydroperoxidase
VSGDPSVPLVEVPAAISDQLAQLGAPPDAVQSRLYQALANQPELLTGWIEFAWRLRRQCSTPTRLRELMIVRAMQIADCQSELAGHQNRAVAAGVTRRELDELETWQGSAAFSARERVALRFIEEMVAGSVSDSTNSELADHFDAAERVELILTAGLYVMVPCVVDALRLSQL